MASVRYKGPNHSKVRRQHRCVLFCFFLTVQYNVPVCTFTQITSLCLLCSCSRLCSGGEAGARLGIADSSLKHGHFNRQPRLPADFAQPDVTEWPGARRGPPLKQHPASPAQQVRKENRTDFYCCKIFLSQKMYSYKLCLFSSSHPSQQNSLASSSVRSSNSSLLVSYLPFTKSLTG